MDSKAQAALEYLMTYGWALIVIAIVVGVLVFIVSSPAGNIVCNSDDPAKIMVKASQVTASYLNADTDVGTIKIVNLTGGDISGITCTGTNAFEFGNIGAAATNCSATLSSGAEMDLLPDAGDTDGTYSSSTISIGYVDYAALDRNATITCSGPITVS